MPRITYFSALKIWNERKNDGMSCTPKKGTSEYREVIEIFNKMKNKKEEKNAEIKEEKKAEVKEEKKKRGRPKKEKVEIKAEIKENVKPITKGKKDPYTQEQKQYLQDTQKDPYADLKDLDKEVDKILDFEQF